MRVRVRRVLAISAIATAVLFAVALLLVHLPPVRARVLSFAARQLATLYDLDLQASGLQYNIFTRHVSLNDVRLAAKGHEQQPFFQASRVAVQLPWSVVRGIFAFDRIELDQAKVDMHRYEDGSSNLPQSKTPANPTRPALRLNVDALTLNSLDFAYADDVRKLQINAGDIIANLEHRIVESIGQAFGPIELRRGVQVHIGERSIDAQPISGSMAFDGSGISLENVQLTTREGSVVVNGAVQRILDQPALDLRFDGTAEIDRAQEWATVPLALAGSAALQGAIQGPAAEPTIKLTAKSNQLRVGSVDRAAIDAAVTITTNTVTVERASIREGAGSLDATATIELTENGVTEVKADWQNLDAPTALKMLNREGDGKTKTVPYEQQYRVASSFTGRMTLRRQGTAPLAITLENRAVAPSAAPRDAAPLSGTLTLDVGKGRWSAQQRHTLGDLTVDGPLSGRIGDDIAATTVDGTLTVDSTDIAAASGAIERLNLDLPTITSELHGPLHANVTLAGPVNSPQVQAAVASDALVVPGLSAAAVRADVNANANRVDVPTLSAHIGHATLDGNVAIDLQKKTLGGSFALDAPDAAEVLTALPASARLTGPITAKGTLGGSTSAPDVRATVEGHGLTLGGQVIDDLAATARVTADTVFVDSLTVGALTGTLNGTGSYAWGSEAYTAKLDGENLDWRGQLGSESETEVRVTKVTFAGSGTVPKPGGAGQVVFQLSGGPAGDIVESGTANVQLDGEKAIVDAQLPSLGAQVKGTVLTSAPYTYDATADIAKLDLLPLATIAGLPPNGVLGRLSLTATAHGEANTAAESSEVTANLQQIAATVGEVPVWLQSPAKLSWRKDDLRVESLTLGLGTGTLVASGRLAPGNDSQWTTTFNGELGDLVRAAHGLTTDVPAELSASGAIAAEWRSTGGLERSNATVTLNNGEVTWADVPPVTGLALQAGFDGTTFTVSSLSGKWSDGAISGTATVPKAILDRQAGAKGHAQLKVTGLTQSSIAPWVDSAALARINGRVSASLDADIFGTTVRDIAGTLVLDEAALNLADIDVQQVRPSKLGIRDGRITLDDVSWTAGGGPLALTGAMELEGPKGATLDLALKGDLNAGILSAFAPTVWTAGAMTIDLTAKGQANNPDLQGKIQLQNGEVAVFDPRLIMYDLNGVIAVDRQQVRFGGIGGSINGGTIRLDGQLGYGGDATGTGQMIVELGQVAMEYPHGLRSEINALLTLTPTGKDWQIGGDVRIARSSYRDNISLPALATARRTRAPVAINQEPTLLDRLRLNVFVSTEDDLVVDNNYGRLQAGAAVRVVGTASEPGLNGRVTLREGGEAYVAGRTFRVEHGDISFTRPTRIEPEFDIELRTPAAGIDVALTLSGTLDQLKTDVRSTNPDRTDKEAQQALYGNLGTEDAATLLSAELLGVTGRAVGLDALRLERGADTEEIRNDPTLIVEDINEDPSTRLTLSKRIRPDVEVIVSRSLRESGGISAAVSYKIRRNIEIRASQRENTDRAIAVRHEITFGGGQRRSSTVAPEPKISAIRITGDPGRPEAEIRSLLHLKEDDRFAFHKWQDDVDRIKADYDQRGFLEARVRPSRSASDDNGTVTLDYRIDQGPKTTIVIEGHDFHEGLVKDLRDAWSRAIFDRFLVDDVRWRVQRDLIDEGYFGSKVEPSIVQLDPQNKQLKIVVAPGTHVTDREVRYQGNTAFSRKRLEQAAAEQGVAQEIWLDPWRLANALAAFYQEQGYLGVNITPSDPKVEGNRAVIDMKVEEGKRFVFTKPTIQGVGDDSRQQPLDRILGFTVRENAPYDTASVSRARERVEGFYLRRGYNNARIEVRSTSDQKAATVTVAVNVEEGSQQILREVVTEGGERTRPGVVRSALRLTEGAPADLGQWAQARKRIYDTNVFAQVDIEPVSLPPTEDDKKNGIEPVRAVVRLTEYPVWRLRYGLQVNDESPTQDEDSLTPSSGGGRTQSLGVLADIQNRNIFGRAIAGGLAGRVERDRQVGTLFASNGSFFGLPIRTQTFFFESRERDREPLDIYLDRVGATFEQRWQPFRRTELVYSYRFDRSRTHEVAPNPQNPFPLDVTNHTGRVTAGIILDRRNDPFVASQGWFTTVNVEEAAHILGGDSRNTKLLAQQYYFHSIGKLVLASRVQVGAAFGKDDLTSDDAFELGGATTVRGYSENGLGPKDAAGLPAGQALLLLNHEWRFPIKGWVNGVWFVDAGNTFSRNSEISFSDLNVGYGFGIRLNTPIAMFRVDFGVPGSTQPGTVRRANSFSSGRWYIGIGHVF